MAVTLWQRFEYYYYYSKYNAACVTVYCCYLSGNTFPATDPTDLHLPVPGEEEQAYSQVSPFRQPLRPWRHLIGRFPCGWMRPLSRGRSRWFGECWPPVPSVCSGAVAGGRPRGSGEDTVISVDCVLE